MHSKLINGDNLELNFPFMRLSRRELQIVFSLYGPTGRLKREWSVSQRLSSISTELSLQLCTLSSLFIKIWMKSPQRFTVSIDLQSNQSCLTSIRILIKFICKFKKIYQLTEVFQEEMLKSVCRDGSNLAWKFLTSWPHKMSITSSHSSIFLLEIVESSHLLIS